MKVSYNRLWKRLIDENMMKRDLRLKAGLTTNVIAKMGKNEHVSTEVICKICETLGCHIDDIIEFIPEDK
ncbi:MAG: helix-turn-helix domain-containing protein [Acetatifactor sp.]